jgi:hypothetical protein
MCAKVPLDSVCPKADNDGNMSRISHRHWSINTPLFSLRLFSSLQHSSLSKTIKSQLKSQHVSFFAVFRKPPNRHSCCETSLATEKHHPTRSMKSFLPILKTYPITRYVDVKMLKRTAMCVSLKTSALTGHEQGALRGYLPYYKR